MTLVSSARRHDLDVGVYVKDVLDQLLAGSTDYHSLLPDIWKQRHPEAVRAYRVEERRDKAERKQLSAARRRLAARDRRDAPCRPGDSKPSLMVQVVSLLSPEEIPARPQSDESELMNDLIELLRKQSTPDLNLVDLFHSILNKEAGEVQRKRFGPSQAAVGRHLIVQTIERYAQATGNWHMLRLLDRLGSASQIDSLYKPEEKSGRRCDGVEIRPQSIKSVS